MKKTLLALSATLIFCQIAQAAPCSINIPQDDLAQACKQTKQYHIQNGCEEKTTCHDKNELKSKKHYSQNECFFDNQFLEMKKVLCLNPQQEACIDNIYARYKNQMQIFYNQARSKQKCLCEAINNCADKSVIRQYKRDLKDLRKETKEQYKCFTKEIKQQLCKDQVKSLNKFNRQEKSKMKKLGKYCIKPVFPCSAPCEVKKSCGCD